KPLTQYTPMSGTVRRMCLPVLAEALHKAPCANLANTSGLFRAFGDASCAGIRRQGPEVTSWNRGPHELGLHPSPRPWVTDRTAGRHVPCPCGLSMPLPQEASAFVPPPVLPVLPRFFPARTPLALVAWPVDDAAPPRT